MDPIVFYHILAPARSICSADAALIVVIAAHFSNVEVANMRLDL